MMRLPAVRVSPTVATSAAIPMTMPSTVSTIRPGRANMPASASWSRSRMAMRDLETFTGRLGSSDTGALRGARSTVWSVSLPSMM